MLFRSRSGTPALNDPQFPSAHYKLVGEQLWQRAGVGPADVDVAQVYENFTGMVVISMSEMGFASPKGIEEFTSNGNIELGGKLPVNTSGGNLAEAYIHGFELVNEAVRQVRGESTQQVAKVEHSLVVAGPGYVPGSAVLFADKQG